MFGIRTGPAHALTEDVVSMLASTRRCCCTAGRWVSSVRHLLVTMVRLPESMHAEHGHCDNQYQSEPSIFCTSRVLYRPSRSKRRIQESKVVSRSVSSAQR